MWYHSIGLQVYEIVAFTILELFLYRIMLFFNRYLM